MNSLKLKLAAELVIVKPGKMSKKGRKQIATWLRNQANMFSSFGDNYTDTGKFCTRYLYTPHNKP